VDRILPYSFAMRFMPISYSFQQRAEAEAAGRQARRTNHPISSVRRTCTHCLLSLVSVLAGPIFFGRNRVPSRTGLDKENDSMNQKKICEVKQKKICEVHQKICGGNPKICGGNQKICYKKDSTNQRICEGNQKIGEGNQKICKDDILVRPSNAKGMKRRRSIYLEDDVPSAQQRLGYS
jgi:hypothetical protein